MDALHIHAKVVNCCFGNGTQWISRYQYLAPVSGNSFHSIPETTVKCFLLFINFFILTIIMLFLRSLIFYIGMFLALLIWGVALRLFIIPLSSKRRYAIIIRWSYFVVWWLEQTCQVKYEVRGLENIPSVPTVVLSKHQSEWETYVFQKIFPRQTGVVKRELLWIPLFGWLLANVKPIAINRKNSYQSLQQLVKQGKQRLAQGLWIIIYPEGTRVRPNEKKRYGVGGAMLAAKAGCPVLPVAHNSGSFWLRNRFIKKPGVIKIVIGPIIEPDGKTTREINALAEKWIEETMLGLE